MILCSEGNQKSYLEAGFWGTSHETHSIDGLLKNLAKEKPDELAFVDAPNRDLWTSGAPRSLTWEAVDRQVEALATFFSQLDLPKDTVIALYGPNTVDMIVSTLGIQRAGFISAPIPLYWNSVEIRDYINEIQARVIISTDRVEHDHPALRCRDLTQDLFSMKYVLGFGDKLPDGVVDIGKFLEMTETPEDDQASFPPVDPNAVISVHPSMLQSADTEVAFARSSNQWLCAADVLIPYDESSSITLSPLTLSGLAGFCAGLVLTIKCGGTLHLHHYQNEEQLSDHIDEVKPEMVLLPQMITEKCLKLIKNDIALRVGSIWKNSHLIVATRQEIDARHSLFDITVLNEIAALSAQRLPGDARPSRLKMTREKNAVSLFLRDRLNPRMKQMQSLAGGELAMSGPGTPEYLFPSNNAKRALHRLRNKDTREGIPTHIGCRLDGDDNSQCEPIGFLVDTITKFHQVTSASELDDIYRELPEVEDAAHFVDPSNGTLNVAVVCPGQKQISLTEFQEALEKIGVTRVKIPVALFQTDVIKRGIGDMVLRSELLPLLKQKNQATHYQQLETEHDESFEPEIIEDMKQAG